MDSYANLPLQQQQQTTQPANFLPQYPPPTSPSSGPFSAQLYPNTDPALQQTPEQGVHRAQTIPPSGSGKVRLRKACDSCSARKVKCDETRPECKACSSLGIPCTFDRQSKRRGPQNKHAESIKKKMLNSTGHLGQSQASSPTHAAHTLASFAQQQVLSAESICSPPILHLLIDDYFTYIHPLIPVPHEHSFRDALHRREDLTNPTFLALLASMIGCLVANFPQKPRQHFRNLHMEHLLPTSMSLVERCHKVAIEAQGPATFNREYTVHDAIISYLQGLTSGYTFNKQPCLLYFRQSLAICTALGLHKASPASNVANGSQPPRMTPNGHSLEGPQARGGDLVSQELGKRIFWILMVGIKSLHQLGTSPFELNIPPATAADPYPPLPVEVDDAYLTPTRILPQPPGTLSELVGFNINARIHSTYQQTSTNELNHGVNVLFNWENQKQELERSVQEIKQIVGTLPAELSNNTEVTSSDPQGAIYPSPVPAPLEHSHQSHYHHSPSLGSGQSERSYIQHEIQKANIHASQLATRSYLVEKYWNLNDALQLSRSANNSIAPALDNDVASPGQDMGGERESIIKELLATLGKMNQVSMEPNGASFIHKTRSIASTLLDAPRSHTGSLAVRIDTYLRAFLDVLLKLERISPANELSSEEDEEVRSRHWANMTENQQGFARAGGFLSNN